MSHIGQYVPYLLLLLLLAMSGAVIIFHRQAVQCRKKMLCAENANRAMTDFLARISHDIRTPLAAISGVAEIFDSAQDNPDDNQKKLVRVLISSTLELKNMVSDITNFSKIER
ncbi:MAG: histidine kinase dimerization/phospho-acceptor domain-containing protein [Pseudomonadota bacterium]